MLKLLVRASYCSCTVNNATSLCSALNFIKIFLVLLSCAASKVYNTERIIETDVGVPGHVGVSNAPNYRVRFERYKQIVYEIECAAKVAKRK